MSEPTPACSVVVPTYQRAASLERLLAALRPVVESSGSRIEVVVVDDGSTDRTSAVLDAAPWVTARRQPNGGAASARNHGWRAARAPVIAFIDDDCLPGPGWPAELLAAFDDPTVGGVGGAIEGQADRPLDRFVAVERLVDHGRDVDDGVDYLVTANAAYRRSALEAAGGFDEDFGGAAGEDVDLAWRIRASGSRLVRSDVAVLHDHRSTVGGILRTYRNHGRARALLDRRHPDQGAGASARRALGLAALRERWRAYRATGTPVVVTGGLLALRYVGLAAYLRGLVGARRGLQSSSDGEVRTSSSNAG